jgi:hypothetical protein
MKFTTKLHVDEVERFSRCEVYKTAMLQLKEIRPRQFLVCVNMEEQDFVCICCKFEKDGIVCAHILRVLIHLNIAELPEKYYISRWKPKNRKEIREGQFNNPVDLTTTNRHLWYSMLSRRLNNIASDGSLSNLKYTYVADKAPEIEAKLDEMTLEEEQTGNVNKQTSSERPPNNSVPQPHPDGYGDFLQDPDVALSKGRPESSKRQRTFMEELFLKNEITCGHYGSHGHNIATCTLLHIPQSYFQKKPTKTRSKTGMTITYL